MIFVPQLLSLSKPNRKVNIIVTFKFLSTTLFSIARWHVILVSRKHLNLAFEESCLSALQSFWSTTTGNMRLLLLSGGLASR